NTGRPRTRTEAPLATTRVPRALSPSESSDPPSRRRRRRRCTVRLLFLFTISVLMSGESRLGILCCSSGVSLLPLADDMVSFEMNDLKKIGLGLTGFGVFFSFLGIIFFFDKGLIAMGNILFLSGLGLTIGLKSTMQFFTKPKNYKGTISFGAGFFLVLIGWPFIGMLLEAYGFVVLFSGFWPTLAVFLQRIPIIGWIFQQPFVTSFLDRYRGKRVPV
ncbi:hypothetical protein EJB05_07604, partial [Eragrostis curvula]